MLCSLHAQPEWVKTPALGNDTGWQGELLGMAQSCQPVDTA
jgi:hypothetical protein